MVRDDIARVKGTLESGARVVMNNWDSCTGRRFSRQAPWMYSLTKSIPRRCRVDFFDRLQQSAEASPIKYITACAREWRFTGRFRRVSRGVSWISLRGNASDFRTLCRKIRGPSRKYSSRFSFESAFTEQTSLTLPVDSMYFSGLGSNARAFLATALSLLFFGNDSVTPLLFSTCDETERYLRRYFVIRFSLWPRCSYLRSYI